MSRLRRPDLAAEVARRNQEQFARLGGEILVTRRRRRRAPQGLVKCPGAGGAEGPYRVAACWVVRPTRRNRELMARYPEVFAARFPGSSLGWVRALAEGTAPPQQPGPGRGGGGRPPRRRRNGRGS